MKERVCTGSEFFARLRDKRTPNTVQALPLFAFSVVLHILHFSPFLAVGQKPNLTRGTGMVHTVPDESSPIPLRKDGIRDSKLPCLMIIRTSGGPCGARR